MKIKSLHLIISSILLMALVVMLVPGCTPDSSGDLGAKPSSVAFTMSPVAGKANTYLLTSTSVGAWGWQWNKGNGTFVKGNQVDTAYFPLKGTYKVQLRAYGRGGYETAEQSVTIAVDDILNNAQFKLLVAKSWKLDPAPGANAIIVGTEANPANILEVVRLMLVKRMMCIPFRLL
jgi:PKD repeat protein